jgi:glucose/arabinose dehydrogenase
MKYSKIKKKNTQKYDLGNILDSDIKGEEIVNGLFNPVYVCAAPGDLTRLYIVEQKYGSTGRVRIFDLQTNTLLSEPFLTVSVSTSSEQGLLGLAFHPNYEENGRLFINYTNSSGDTVIEEFNRETNNTASSNKIIMTINQPYSNHNSGPIRFNPKDTENTENSNYYLYITTGDGGSGGDPGNRAQNLSQVMGKLLRVGVGNIDLPYGNSSDPYATSDTNSGILNNIGYQIPSDNPFLNQDGLNEIYAYGLRNPWQFTFDSNGDLYLADVGQNAWEEVNIVKYNELSGSNFGWRCYEGNHSYNSSGCDASNTMTFPVCEYSHGGNPYKCSITGGLVYEGNSILSLMNHYLFADYCSSQIWSFNTFTYDGIDGNNQPNNEIQNKINSSLGSNITSISGFGCDSRGEVYICSHNGKIYKIKDTNSVTGQINLNQGWNMISIPHNSFIIAADMLSTYPLFTYKNNEYISIDSDEILEPGKGYWVKCDTSTTISYENKDPLSSLNIVLNIGWDMIGTLSYETVIALSGIDNIFEFNNGTYIEINNNNNEFTLESGKGYWLKYSSE